MMRVLCVFLSLLLCLSMTACQPNSPDEPEVDTSDSSENKSAYRPLLYEVTDEDGSRVWLFGSIHVGDESMVPFPSYVTKAYEEADALAVECDVLEADAELSAKLFSMMGNSMYKDGSTIQDHVDEQVYEDAKELLQLHNLYSSIYDHYSPIIWWLLLQEVAIAQTGYDSQSGVDMQLLTEAYNTNKPVLEIESVDEQYEMLFGFSHEIQEMLLEETVNGLNQPFSKMGMRMLLQAWKSGNEELLVTMLATESEGLSGEDALLYEEYDRMMVGDRNVLMTDFAEDMLTSDQEVFICVGAAHVVGDDAMADLLEERGYTVKLVQ